MLTEHDLHLFLVETRVGRGQGIGTYHLLHLDVLGIHMYSVLL